MTIGVNDMVNFKSKDLNIENNRKKNIVFMVTSFIIILGFAMLAFLFPYTCDDWAWGSIYGIKRLNAWFDGYNGRYAGNLLVMLLTRVPALKTIFMAVSYYLIGLFAYKYSNSKRLSILLFGTALFFTMPKEIFVQSVVWTSGYTNYVPPILMMIGYIILIKNIFNQEKPVYAKPLFILTFLLGFIGAMFMENLTLYSIAAAVLVIIYCAVKFKKAFLPHISYFVGTAAGAVMMFTNSSYGAIFSNRNGDGDGYRSLAVGSGSFIKSICSHLKVIYTQLFTNNSILLIILTVLSFILLGLKVGKMKNKKWRNLIIFSSVINVFSLFLILFKSNFYYWRIFIESKNSSAYTIIFFSMAAAVYYISVSVIIIGCLDGPGVKDKAVFLLISIPIIVAPLVLVNPIGPRNFFPPFMLMVLLSVLILENILETVDNRRLQKVLSLAFAAVIVASSIYYFSIYVPIYRYDELRNENAVKQSQENDVVTLCTLPYESYVWRPDPVGKLWEDRYKKFYGIDEQIQFEFVEYYDYNID